jgi:hypothetical protein
MANKYKKQQVKIATISKILLGAVVLMVALLIVFALTPKAGKAIANDYNKAIVKNTPEGGNTNSNTGYLDPNDTHFTKTTINSLISKIKKGEPVVFLIGGTYYDAVRNNIAEINKIYNTSLYSPDINSDKKLSNVVKRLYLVNAKSDAQVAEFIDLLNEKLADVEGYVKVPDAYKFVPFMMEFNNKKFIGSLYQQTESTLSQQLKNFYLKLYNDVKPE